MARDYAQALFELIKENPSKGKEYLKNLKEALARRGHEKLLPRIFSEYEKLVAREERAQQFARINPKEEQKRILIELYQKLIHA
ncbi:MAG TPA: hypothetical protein VD928_02845 [Candidatus Paceibacterota bacterium]|nr:hypothetical protein [Candidatus Paceibacterota bacterium]